MENLKLRIADENDEPFLFKLFSEIRGSWFAGAGVPNEQLIPVLEMQYKAQMNAYRYQYPEANDSIVEIDQTRVGRFFVDRGSGTSHIVDMSILEEFRGKGVGSILLNGLMANAEKITLSVYHDNKSAQKFYERHQFAVVSRDEMYLKMEWKNVR